MENSKILLSISYTFDEDFVGTFLNSFKVLDAFSMEFPKKFPFYIESIDNMFRLQGEIGFERDELSSLNELDQLLVKAYLFLVESSNTTTIGCLRLLSSNIYSDAYSLIRILYEIACLLHWGNVSKENKLELYHSIFKSDLPSDKHYRNEWKLIKKAQKLYESEKPELVSIRQKLNNFGGHISREKIVLGNITNIGDSVASSLFIPNFNNKHLLMGLDFTHSMFNLILDEYSCHLKRYNAVPKSIDDNIKLVSRSFITSVRPKLQKFMSNG